MTYIMCVKPWSAPAPWSPLEPGQMVALTCAHYGAAAHRADDRAGDDVADDGGGRRWELRRGDGVVDSG